MSHCFYHIPGLKVGCTNNLETRKKWYSPETEFDIIGTFEGMTHQEAGDFEWFWADLYGYPRGPHYASIPSVIDPNFHKGIPSWNKGLKTGPCPEHSERMKGRPAWNKGLKTGPKTKECANKSQKEKDSQEVLSY